MASAKSELRRIYLEKQKSLSPADRDDFSKLIAGQFFANVSLKNTKTLHLFIPIERNHEIDTRYIYERLWRENPHIKTVLPRVDFKRDEIESVEFNRDTKLKINKWDIPEPEKGKVIDPKEIDMVVVPLLCFDERGYRVGYGKGFYDKFLSACHLDVQKIGLSYFEAVDDIPDINKFDQAIDICVTPKGILLLN